LRGAYILGVGLGARVSVVNTGRYGAFLSAFGMKMIHFFVSTRERLRLGHTKAPGFNHGERLHPVPTFVSPATMHAAGAPKAENLWRPERSSTKTGLR